MRYALAVLLLCAPAYGAIVNEIEPNDSPASATPIPQSAFTLPIPVNVGAPFPTASLLGEVERGRPDRDYFSFFGFLGDRLVVDVDNAGLPGGSSDIFLRLLFGSQLLVSNDDCNVDPGSNSSHDACIGLPGGPFILPATGTYFLDVHGTSDGNPGTYLVQVSKSVPEPSTLALLLTGLLLLCSGMSIKTPCNLDGLRG